MGFKHLAASLLVATHLAASAAQNDVDFWNVERPRDMANIKSLDVMCGKTHMEVQISFDKPYNGIIFSKGAVDQYNCIYVKPQTGATAYSFNIMYDQVSRPLRPSGTISILASSPSHLVLPALSTVHPHAPKLLPTTKNQTL